jgi:TetR/AcrR family transcriptional regulator
MDPVDPIHLFILLWGTTQYYADFDVLAKSHLQTARLGAAEFERAAETITAIVLKGCGIAPVRGKPQRAVRSADRLRG